MEETTPDRPVGGVRVNPVLRDPVPVSGEPERPAESAPSRPFGSGGFARGSLRRHDAGSSGQGEAYFVEQSRLPEYEWKYSAAGRHQSSR